MGRRCRTFDNVCIPLKALVLDSFGPSQHFRALIWVNQTTVVSSSLVYSRHFHCRSDVWHRDPRRSVSSSNVGSVLSGGVRDVEMYHGWQEQSLTWKWEGGGVRGLVMALQHSSEPTLWTHIFVERRAKICYRWNVLTCQKNTHCSAALEAGKLICDVVAPQFPANMGLPLRKASLFSPDEGVL